MSSYLFDVKGNSVGLIKYAEGTKKKAKFPHQWLNYLQKNQCRTGSRIQSQSMKITTFIKFI